MTTLFRRFTNILISASLLVLVVGCKKTIEDTGSLNNPSSLSEPIQLRIMWWGSQPRHNATLKALELYKRIHPNVTFETEYSGIEGYLDKLSSLEAAKRAPDIIQLDPSWIADWTSKNLLADLSSVNLSKVDPKLLDIGKRNDIPYAVPLGSVAYGMIYNKKAMENLGLPLPRNGWTWDDFFALARSFKEVAKEGQYFTKYYAGDYFMYSAYQYAQGKGPIITKDGLFNIDKNTFLQWTKQFEELREDGIVVPEALNLTDRGTADLLSNGKILIRDAYTSEFLSWDRGNPNVYEMVTAPRSTEAGGWFKPSMYFSVSAYSNQKVESLKFLNWFLNDPEAAQILGTTRGVPANSEIADSIQAYLSRGDKIGMQLYYATLQDGQMYSPEPQGFAEYIEKDYAMIRDQLIFAKITPEEAFEKLRAAANGYKKTSLVAPR
ncbi:ABC transporter substrate-binding protein [Paenibacillus silviterrae]|uniref:ABC transporter substrate-binding protein n=1 Tax=Paenibacillus silviterrae TaxID=3242194 RepID=UPI0025431D69|nr:ABC transporter substrate-binding protein [Paenibacillus chinjuensis]